MLACLLFMIALMAGLVFASVAYLGGYYRQKCPDQTVTHWHELAEWASGGLFLLMVYLFLVELLKDGGVCTLVLS